MLVEIFAVNCPPCPAGASVEVEDQERNLGPDGYYSEDEALPDEAWIVAQTDDQVAAVTESLGVRKWRAR
ncbi:hypothetical protein [Corynebacterium sp.]|uniref:hypothetical protein n=1 Tax=Corynebacterium sp. TaxID=1720 RepID=UPI0026DCE354|nr:hypothetical protein [Corynebacterium sp.]MDO5076710.1 hypothetical protein [Corynebacterium sp.]